MKERMTDIRLMVDGKCISIPDEKEPNMPPTTDTHTPAPWKVGPRTEYSEGVNIWAGSLYIGKIKNDKTQPKESADANAAFIVLAVNAHEELIACLKSCRLTMNTAGMPVGHIDNAIANAERK